MSERRKRAASWLGAVMLLSGCTTVSQWTWYRPADAATPGPEAAVLDAAVLDSASMDEPDVLAGPDALEVAVTDALDADALVSSGEAGVVEASTGDATACPTSLLNCGGACVNPATDPNHCGSCARACAVGMNCVLGACVCPPGRLGCGGACVDPLSDVGNCGGCGRACAVGNVCTNGLCLCPGMQCAGSFALCSNLRTEPRNCGNCGTTCGDTQACVGGNCVCRPGLAQCMGNCTDTLHSNGNCGACGASCGSLGPSGRCIDGGCISAASCAALGRVDCGGACYTTAQLQSDPLNCGACGRACPSRMYCAGGSCVDFVAATGCTACPCASCGAGPCCMYAGAPVCPLGGGRCPG